MTIQFSFRALYFASFAVLLDPAAALADSPSPPAVSAHYADLADLAEGAELVVRASPRKLVQLEAARAPGLRQGWARFYIEARTEALIAGNGSLGQQLRYLVDLPLDAKGKAPKLKKKSVLLFARSVAARPGELQLVAPDAQLLWDPAIEQRLRAVLQEVYAPDAPQKIAGLREAIHVAGDLAGESETQLFFTTTKGEPMAINVARSPGQAPRWGVSFSELVAGEGAAPARETLGWYRLACFLPRQMPAATAVAGSAADRAAAARDYRFVIEQLGPCPRIRG